MEEPSTILIRDEYGMLKPGNRIILRSFNEYIGNKHKLEALYAGLNKNPDIDLKNAPKERDSGEQVQPHFMHDGIHIVHPFVDIRKDWIIQQYYEHKITDLLHITRSCEGEFQDINYKTYSPGQYVPTCGECFWCQEKEWALTNINDR
jgi:7-cyano-7-deazaguanine synthase in queuosine biosynthesis